MTPEQKARIDAIYRGPIALTPVSSSQIGAIGHHAETNTLAIQFKPREDEVEGSVYHFSNVDRAAYDELANASSVGGHFYKTIKPDAVKYPFVKARLAVKADSDSKFVKTVGAMVGLAP
jgi:hypothetical protein